MRTALILLCFLLSSSVVAKTGLLQYCLAKASDYFLPGKQIEKVPFEHPQLDRRVAEIGYRDYVGTNTDRSYRLIGKIPGENGGKLNIFELDHTNSEFGHSEWFNPNTNYGDAFRGGLNWNEEFLGPEVAEFLGFKQLDPYHYQAPDAKELAARIKNLNGRIENEKDKIAMTFYEPKIDRTPDESYSEQWAAHAAHPISQKTDELPHDLNYHLGGIVMPRSLVEHQRNQVKFLLKWRDFTQQASRIMLDKGKISRAQVDGFKAAIDLALSNAATNIDRMTGAVNLTFNPNIPQGYKQSLGTFINEHLVWGGGSAKEALVKMFYDTQYMSSTMVKDPLFKSFMDKFLELEDDPIFSAQYNFQLEEVNREVHKKIEILREAATREP